MELLSFAAPLVFIKVYFNVQREKDRQIDKERQRKREREIEKERQRKRLRDREIERKSMKGMKGFGVYCNGICNAYIQCQIYLHDFKQNSLRLEENKFVKLIFIWRIMQLDTYIHI